MEYFLYIFISIFLDSFNKFIALAPYAILGSFLAKGFAYTNWAELLSSAVSKSSVTASVLASLLGIASPLCTYGTVPIVSSLYSAGVHFAPLLVFLFTSSMLNPQLMILTYGSFGLRFLLIRLLSVFLFGIISGFILYSIPSRFIVRETHAPSPKAETETIPVKQFHLNEYLRSVLDNIEFIGLYLVIGIIMGSAIETLVPASAMASLFQNNSFISILSASVLSVPLYACGGGVIPLVRSLMASGMDTGAAIAFFNVGSTTRVPIITTLLTVLKPLCIVIYIIFLMVYSFVFGLFWR